MSKRMVAGDDYGRIKKGSTYKVVKEGVDYMTVLVAGTPMTCYRWLFYDENDNPYKAYEPREEQEDEL